MPSLQTAAPPPPWPLLPTRPLPVVSFKAIPTLLPHLQAASIQPSLTPVLSLFKLAVFCASSSPEPLWFFLPPCGIANSGVCFTMTLPPSCSLPLPPECVSFLINACKLAPLFLRPLTRPPQPHCMLSCFQKSKPYMLDCRVQPARKTARRPLPPVPDMNHVTCRKQRLCLKDKATAPGANQQRAGNPQGCLTCCSTSAASGEQQGS